MLSYSIEPSLTASEFISVLNNSTLGERRPVDDPDRIAKMLAHAVDYYPKIGMTRHEQCFMLDDVNDLG